MTNKWEIVLCIEPVFQKTQYCKRGIWDGSDFEKSELHTYIKNFLALKNGFVSPLDCKVVKGKERTCKHNYFIYNFEIA